MRVAVTGGSGKLGQAVVADLTDHGHHVISLDQRPPSTTLPGVRFVKTDLLDTGAIAGGLRSCDALIHLGAIPNPYGHPDEVVFANNTQATFAALNAASLLGIKRAAFASSVSAYGAAWALKPLLPRYAPVDEAHPMDNHDAYGLSKEVDERTAEMFSRRDGMQIAGLRFHWVATPEEQAKICPVDSEYRKAHAKILWGYIDIRDAASACRLAVEREFPGFQPFNIVAADTLAAIPTEQLLAELAPSVEIRSPIPGTTGGYATAKAREMLGWQPQFSWRCGTSK